MPRYLHALFGIGIAALLMAGPIAYKHCWDNYIRNLRVVSDGVLYRSGQLSLSGLKRVIHDYGIKTVISLRDGIHKGDPPPDLREEEYCLSQDLNYCRISPRSWWAEAGSAPAEEGVHRFHEVMDNRDNYPVLIHCLAGIHRTGAFTAIYRMEYQHWSNEEALAELRACGYSNLDDEWDIRGFLERYHPRWQPQNEAAIETTSQKLEVPIAHHKKRRTKKGSGVATGIGTP